MHKLATSHTKDLGAITKRFSERCKEYHDSKIIKLKPSTLKTVRTHSDSFALPVTNQVLQIEKTAILNNVNEYFILN